MCKQQPEEGWGQVGWVSYVPYIIYPISELWWRNPSTKKKSSVDVQCDAFQHLHKLHVALEQEAGRWMWAFINPVHQFHWSVTHTDIGFLWSSFISLLYCLINSSCAQFVTYTTQPGEKLGAYIWMQQISSLLSTQLNQNLKIRLSC